MIKVQPPSVGTYVDSQGRTRNVAILKGRINGQYISEGLTAALGLALAGLAVIWLHQVSYSCTLLSHCIIRSHSTLYGGFQRTNQVETGKKLVKAFNYVQIVVASLSLALAMAALQYMLISKL